MKFNEAVEIISASPYGGASKSFKVNGKGPFSIHDLEQSTNPQFNRVARTLLRNDVRKIIASNINKLKIDDDSTYDIVQSADGNSIVVNSDSGQKIATVDLTNKNYKMQNLKGKRFT